MLLRFISIFMLILPVSIAKANDTTLIKQTFEQYVSSILNDDGESAYGLVDRRTREYYAWLQDGAVSFDKDDIQKLSFVDRMQILIMRHRIPKQMLTKMHGKALFIYAVNKGWVGKNGVSNLGVGEVRINKNFAMVQVVSRGKATPLNYHFYKENATWKIDITEMSKWGEAALLFQQKKSGQSEEAFIFTLLSAVSKKAVDEKSIYLPLKSKYVP